MNHLVAKAVLDQLNLREIVELSAPDQIHVRTPYDHLYEFHHWSLEGDKLHLYYGESKKPEFSLPLDSKIRHYDSRFYIEGRDLEIILYKMIPFSLASLVSPEKHLV